MPAIAPTSSAAVALGRAPSAVSVRLPAASIGRSLGIIEIRQDDAGQPLTDVPLGAWVAGGAAS